jgi:hypothetical protein
MHCKIRANEGPRADSSHNPLRHKKLRRQGRRFAAVKLAGTCSLTAEESLSKWLAALLEMLSYPSRGAWRGGTQSALGAQDALRWESKNHVTVQRVLKHRTSKLVYCCCLYYKLLACF